MYKEYEYNKLNKIKNKKMKKFKRSLFITNYYYDLIKIFKNPYKYRYYNKKKYSNYNYNFIRNNLK